MPKSLASSLLFGLVGGILAIITIFALVYYSNEISTSLFRFNLAESLASIFGIIFVVLFMVRLFQRFKENTELNKEDVDREILQHKNSNFFQTYRGFVIILFSLILLLSIILSFFDFGLTTMNVMLGLIIYIPILFFVYRGKSWALIILMLVWTIDKFFQIYGAANTGNGNVKAILFYWIGVMAVLGRAYLIEDALKKQKNYIVKLENKKKSI